MLFFEFCVVLLALACGRGVAFQFTHRGVRRACPRWGMNSRKIWAETAVFGDLNLNSVAGPRGEPNAPSALEEGSPGDPFEKTSSLIVRAGALGLSTGLAVMAFKTSIAGVSLLLYEDVADILPKPVFYWPIVLFPVFGSAVVTMISRLQGASIGQGIDSIASSVNAAENVSWDEVKLRIARTCGAVFTLGSGNSLGPEGAGLSRLVVDRDPEVGTSQRRTLFLAGTAAGVAAGFSAPITGIFFALECGNRYLKGSGAPVVLLDDDTSTLGDGLGEEATGQGSGPRADIAAIVLAATAASVVSNLGAQESTLAIQGNSYAMVSPLFELPAYLGLGVVCGSISAAFSRLQDLFVNAFQAEDGVASRIPQDVRPLLGGLVCGLTGLFLPQTLFNSYATLDQLLVGKGLELSLLLQLLASKLVLSAFCIGSGLIGGVFAPALFFGAVAGAAYQHVAAGLVEALQETVGNLSAHAHATGDASALAWFFSPEAMTGLSDFVSVADAPAYATVGAAATLGAIFRAPLTASMLLFELTQNHDLVLPVLSAAGLGGLFADIIDHPSKQR